MISTLTAKWTAMVAKLNQLFTTIYLNTAEPAMVRITSQRSRRQGRGATFIEYALLAGLAVVLFLAIRGPLRGVIDNAIDRLDGARN